MFGIAHRSQILALLLWPLGPQPTALVDAQQCLAALPQTGWEFTVIPDNLRADGCGWEAAVRLSGGPVKLSSPAVLTCAMAQALADWEPDIQQAAQTSFGTGVRTLHHLGTYNCRPIRGNSSRLSEHAHANALDLSAVTLTDGRRIVLKSSSIDDPFFTAIARSACRHFRVVLGPRFNPAHRDHLHLDLGPFRSCR